MNNLKKIFFLINLLNKKIYFYRILLLSFFSSIFEIIGLGMLIPIVSIILDPQNFVNKIPFDSIKLILLAANEHLLFFSLVFFAIFFIIKSLFLAYAISYNYKFAFNIDFHLKKKLLEKYMFLNYSFHLSRSAANLTTIVQKESSNLINNYLLNLITIVSEGLVLILILFFLFYIDTQLTFFTILFISISVYFFLKINKSKLKKYGQERNIQEESFLKNIQDLFGAIKEIKIFLSSKFFLDKNFQIIQKLNYINRKYLTYQQLPRIFLEVICLISFFCIIGYMTYSSYDSIKLVSILAAYLASIFRLLPSINRIMFALQGMTYSSSSLNIVYNDIIFVPKENEKNILNSFEKDQLTFNDKIVISNVGFINPLSQQYILQNINLEILKNSKIGIYGDSGVGKSTLLNIILSLLKPSFGSMTVDGVDVFKNILSWRKSISYVSQSPYIFSDDLKSNVAIGENLVSVNKKLLDESINVAELEILSKDLLSRSKNSLGDRGLNISGGQTQRIAIARALYKQSSIIIFDEATSGLDVSTEEKIINKIFEISQDKTLIFVTHKLSSIKNCDKIYELTKHGLQIRN